MSAVDNTMWVKLNNGDVVERPYREAVRLLSRRLADPAEVPEVETVPLDDPMGDPAVAALVDEFSKSELVDLAEKNDLPTSGNKPDLVARLLAANVELSAAPVAGATPEDVPVESADAADGRD